MENNPKVITETKSNKVLFIAVISTVCIAFAGIVVANLLNASNIVKNSLIASPSITPTVTVTPTPHIHNVAILGYGGGTHQGGALTDSIIIARINDETKKVHLLSLPRDTWVNIPTDVGSAEKQYEKINAAYAFGLDDRTYPKKAPEFQSKNGGGGALAKYAISQVTGEKVDNFIAVSFSAFSDAIDTLGGLDVNVTRGFEDKFYPIEGKENDTCEKSEEDMKAIEATLSGHLREEAYPCRFETLSISSGLQHMDGATALKFVRSRHSETEGGDFSRGERQRQVILALKDKLLSIESIPSLISILSKISNYVSTDYNISDLGKLASFYQSRSDYEIIPIQLSTDNVMQEKVQQTGAYSLVPKGDGESWKYTHEYLQDIFAGDTPASAGAKLKQKLITPTVISPTISAKNST